MKLLQNSSFIHPYLSDYKSIIRKATLADISEIYNLYKIVASTSIGNLTQEEDEISLSYVQEMLENGLQRGLVLVSEKNSHIIGYFKAFTSQYRCLAHVLTNATLMIHPEWQNKGCGGELVVAYLNQIKTNLCHIRRFELLPHQSNQKAINFYLKYGFTIESQLFEKIRNIDGNFESEIVMTWFNPNFSPEHLHQYYLFLEILVKSVSLVQTL